MLFFPRSPFVHSLLLLLCQAEARITLDIQQSPELIMVQEGESVNITCLITKDGEYSGVNIKRRFRKLMYFSEKNIPFSEDDNEFANRYSLTGTARNLTITLRQLQKNDTDWYICDAVLISNYASPTPMFGGGTLLIVTGEQQRKMLEQQGRPDDPWMWERPLIIALAFVILILGTVIIVQNTRIKQCYQTKKKKCARNTVYEDMSCSQRRNTMTRPHFYNGQQVSVNNDNTPFVKDNMGYLVQTPLANHGNGNLGYSGSPY